MAFRLPRDARLVRFPSSDGLGLEGRLTPGDRHRAVVLCHPHPRYGGSMLTPVILRVEQVFREAGHTTLAFNFRGVGGSEGVSGDGAAEVADVQGALAFLADTLGGSPSVQAVAGYSFGSVVGGRAAAGEPRVSFYLGIAPPLALDHFRFLEAVPGRIALIGGRHDEFGDPVQLEALAAGLPRAPWVRVLDTDHFFTGTMEELTEACRDAIAWAEGATDA